METFSVSLNVWSWCFWRCTLVRIYLVATPNCWNKRVMYVENVPSCKVHKINSFNLLSCLLFQSHGSYCVIFWGKCTLVRTDNENSRKNFSVDLINHENMFIWGHLTYLSKMVDHKYHFGHLVPPIIIPLCPN